MATPVMSDRRVGLMAASPERPGDDEGWADGRPEQEAGQEVADLRNGRHQGGHAGQAAVGLVSFALLAATRRNSAANLARKAAATITRLM